MDTKMWLPPAHQEKMSVADVAKHAVKWASNVGAQLAYIARDMVPHGYVQILREPSTGEEWLHYGTRWLNMEVTDNKVRLAFRSELLEREREELASIEWQIKQMEKIRDDQKKRINALEILDR